MSPMDNEMQNQPASGADDESIAISQHFHSRELPPVRRISSAELLQNARLLEIEHGERIYKLRLTQGGKLLLTS